MSEEQHEPSYYEIALTGRQVTGAFVVVLVCLLVAFFAGVWIGRGAPREVLAETAAATTVPPPVDNELSFFNDRPATPEPKEQTKPAPPVTPAPAPVRVPESAPVAVEPAPVERVPPPVVEPAPEPKPEPKVETKVEAPKPAPAPPVATEVAGPLVIQVFTSSDEAKAKNMLKQLKAKNFKAYLSPAKSNGRTVYRVRVGPFQKEADAKATSDKIEKQFKVETWITRTP